MQQMSCLANRLQGSSRVGRALLPSITEQLSPHCCFRASQEALQTDREADDPQSPEARRRKQESGSDPVEEGVADPDAAEKEQDDDKDTDPVEALNAHHAPQSNVGNPDDDEPGHGGKA